MDSVICCSSPPDPPDYGPLADASEADRIAYQELMNAQLDWSKRQWADQKQLLDQIVDVQVPMMRDQLENARNAQARYEELYQPMEEDYLARAAGWDTPERRAQRMGEASAEVASQFEAQRQNALRSLESYGVDPSVARSQALDLGVRVEQAKAQALAANQTRDQTEREAMGMLGESINIGRGLPSMGMQYSSQALQAGQNAAQNAGAWQNASAAIGTPTQYGALSGNALGNWAGALGSQYNAQIGQYNAGQQRSAGIGSLLGGAAGLFLGGPTGAAAGASLGSGMGGLMAAEGGEIRAAPGAAPDQTGQQPVPMTGHDGEYVLPKDVVRRLGTNKLDSMVEKEREKDAARLANANVTQRALAIPPPEAVA